MKKQSSSSIFYNAEHSPIGAFASFTLGAKGTKGGLGAELAKPADQNVFVGLEDAQGTFSCLPFFDQGLDDRERFAVETKGNETRSGLRSFPDTKITRSLSPARDEWQAGDLTFVIHTPVTSAPDPESSSVEAQKLAYVPSLAIEITVDNRKSKRTRRVIFGFQGNDPYRGMRRLDESMKGIANIACGDLFALASNSPGVTSALGFMAEEILRIKEPATNDLGSVGLLIGTVPAGKKVTFNYVACFHRSGTATSGLESRYYYTKFFRNLEAVVSFSLDQFSKLRDRGIAFDKKFNKSPINASRKFMLAQAIHSYYASTELLEAGGKILWAVNEGEYRMLNTFDLTVDQLFFEMKLNPWTVRNELDWFSKRYSYTDTVELPGNAKKYPGGVAFTHDMGVANHFSRPGHSVYEKGGLHGCFSHMCHEELVNWIICALTYEHQTRDRVWLKKTLPLFQKTLTSLLQRDHPDPKKRDGIMSLDGSRCEGGSEITTYDSLDVSLGQARNNLYLGVKTWGCYVGMEALFQRLGDSKRAKICRDQSHLAAKTICDSADADGLLPAILHENVTSRIIPAIEGLIVPHVLGLKSAVSESGEFSDLIKALKKHLAAILKPGICLFPDGAWKISSTSNNSWLSKVYLCQYVAEEILGYSSPKAMTLADQRHAAWLLEKENSYWAWSDQFISGVAKGSKYYPRGVTSVLWLD